MISIILLLEWLTVTHMVNVNSFAYTVTDDRDKTVIENISQEYLNSLELTMDKPIVYNFVKYKETATDPLDLVTLGSFYEWDNKYYINISSNIVSERRLREVIIHETRHMVVEYLKNNDILDLSDYTEEIAQGTNKCYNALFFSAVDVAKNNF